MEQTEQIEQIEQTEQMKQVELDDSELQNVQVQGGLSKDEKIAIALSAAGTHLAIGTVTTSIALRRGTIVRVHPV